MIEKIRNRTLVQRLKVIVIGVEKPNLFTQISVWIAFVSWAYLLIWHVLTLITLLFFGTLKNAAHLRASFDAIGRRNYGFEDTLNKLWLYTLTELILFGFILFGLVLIWRQKKIGFLFYIFGNIATALVTLILMGITFIKAEGIIFDYSLLAILTIYFIIGNFMFNPKKIEDDTIIHTQS